MDAPCNGAFCYEDSIIVERLNERISDLKAKIARLTQENEALKMWRDNDPYYKAGKRAAEAAIDAWEKDCIRKDHEYGG